MIAFTWPWHDLTPDVQATIVFGLLALPPLILLQAIVLPPPRRRWVLGPSVLLVLTLLLVSTVAHAQPGAVPPPEQPTIKTPFDQGRFNLGLGLNFGRTNANERYYVFGGGLGYYVLDGVEVNFGAAIQFGAGPTILRTTCGITPPSPLPALPRRYSQRFGRTGRWPFIASRNSTIG